jgi:hypothetical protein
VRIIGAFFIAIFLLLVWYILVDYAPALLQSSVVKIGIPYQQFIVPPPTSTYFTYFLILVIAVVAGYVAHRMR